MDDGISFRIIYNINISVDIRSYPYIPMNSMDSNRWIVDGSPGLYGGIKKKQMLPRQGWIVHRDMDTDMEIWIILYGRMDMMGLIQI